MRSAQGRAIPRHEATMQSLEELRTVKAALDAGLVSQADYDAMK